MTTINESTMTGRRRSSIGELVRKASSASLSTIKNQFVRRSSTISRHTIDFSLVDELRDRLRTELYHSSNKSGHNTTDDIDSRDAQFALSDGQFLHRCVTEYAVELTTNDRDVAVSKLTKYVMDCLRLRKQLGYSNLKPSELPVELYDSRILCGYEKEPDPKVLVYVRVVKLRKIDQKLDPMYIQFLMANVNWLISRLKDRSLNLVLDTSGISLSQLELVVNLAFAMYNLFPGCLEKCYIVELPFFYRAGLSVLLRMFPDRIRSKLVMLTKSELITEIGPEKVPNFMGGLGDDNLEWTSDAHIRPSNCWTIDDYAKCHGISASSVKKAKQEFEKVKRMKN